jgi:Ca-activated chloride channel family protein
MESEKMFKDVIFVIDVSGSMNGEKIEQAREALKYCVNSLKSKDRFDIIRFSSSVENFQGELNKAGVDEKNNAGYFINNLTASGGTNINGALQQALQLISHNNDRPTSIVFLTDGLPTEGETNVTNILKNFRNIGKDFIRVFCFGVGYDVNTFLLDKLSIDTHGSTNYVKTGENIEREVSAFFSKISSPVLTDPELDFSELDVYDVYPQKLPDVFMGQNITVFGRYRRPGRGKVVLTGRQSENILRFDYSLKFENRIEENEFISMLWANRKVSHLMNQIRFNGENPELVESIKNLGREYGIVTPYTSYLVKEQEKEFARAQADVLSGEAGASMVKLHSEQIARDKRSELDEESVGSGVYYDALVSKPKTASSSTGKSAVMSSRVMKKLENSDVENKMVLTICRIGDKTYHLADGYWVEDGLSSYSEADRTIQFLSEEYFTLNKSYKELNKILSLGEKLIFRFNGEIIRID